MVSMPSSRGLPYLTRTLKVQKICINLTLIDSSQHNITIQKDQWHMLGFTMH